MKENKRQTVRTYTAPKLSSFGKVSDLTKNSVSRPGARIPRPGALIEENGVS